jgi:putative phosphoesterase
MKRLVLSDIHGNLAALEAVLAEPHDAVICLGDIVGTGPEPAACVRRLRDEITIAVHGNHDWAIATGEPPGGPEPFRALAGAALPLAAAQLDGNAMTYLRALPRSMALDLEGWRCLLVHATPRDPLSRAVGPDPAAWTAEVAGVDAEVVLVGHTHVQFDLPLARHRVVNPGSIGLPLDGDPRAAYAVLDGGAIALRRVAYPIDRTVAALHRAKLPAPVVAELEGWLHTGCAPERRGPLA